MRESTVETTWLACLLAIAVPYTIMAFELEWRTEAGRVGPGFFPRVIGVALVAVLAISLGRSWQRQRTAEDERVTASGHVRTLLLVIGATLLFLLLFEVLGALISSMAYMLAVLAALNQGRWLVNLLLALALPGGLYLLFQTWLNAGLPAGLLGTG